MKRRHFGWHTAAVGLTLLFVLPLWWMGVASQIPAGSPPIERLLWWPTSAGLGQNLQILFDTVPVTRYLTNSISVAFFGTGLSWLIASIAGFAISQLPHTQRRFWTVATASMLVIPLSAVWLTRFWLFGQIGLVDSLLALMAPGLLGGNALFVLLFVWTFRRLPDALLDAARLDGVGWLSVWWWIARPLSRPTSAVVAILAFSQFWSEFTDPVLYIYDTSKYTLPFMLQLLNQMDPTNLPLLMTGALLTAAPIILLTLAGGVWIGRLLDSEPIRT